MALPTPNSSDPGYLLPQDQTQPLQGELLQDFVHDMIQGVTGLVGSMIRPTYQGVPPNVPDAGVCWCAFGITSRPADTNAYISHDSAANDGDGADKMQRQETLNVQCAFYDLGSSGLADKYADLMRDGFQVPQNREVLQAAGWGFVESGEPTPMPVLLKERWLYRMDITLQFRRQIDRTYAVLNLKQGDITVHTETQTVHIDVVEP